MSAYDTYINELEDLHAYTQGEDFDIGEYLRRLYQLYKNGNFLVIRLIGDFSKRMAEELKDNSFYNFALTIYQAGPTKILDLDFSDQMDFLLHKGEFLADYAKNIDPSYKQMALEALNEYGNMANDGRHMKAKAYLEKPTDENDTLNMEVFKVRLLEYFSYGNELSEEELSLVGIPSSYLSMEKEQLKELLKQYEKNPEELKKVYYVLLYKGEINYVSALAKIDKQFILDYYMKKKIHSLVIQKPWICLMTGSIRRKNVIKSSLALILESLSLIFSCVFIRIIPYKHFLSIKTRPVSRLYMKAY